MKEFEKYLLNVGIRSHEYNYSDDDIIDNVDYFRKCFYHGLSPYKSLLYFDLDLFCLLLWDGYGACRIGSIFPESYIHAHRQPCRQTCIFYHKRKRFHADIP